MTSRDIYLRNTISGSKKGTICGKSNILFQKKGDPKYLNFQSFKKKIERGKETVGFRNKTK